MTELMRIVIGEKSDRNLSHFRGCGKPRGGGGAKANAPTHTTIALP